ncbi:MAG: hypothetical protein LUD02_09710 [Tannerellaceae bacterium]|nr:hypothetical protein [Tannerellaceae bacterium]
MKGKDRYFEGETSAEEERQLRRFLQPARYRRIWNAIFRCLPISKRRSIKRKSRCRWP